MTTESAGPDAGPLTDAELGHLRWLAGAHPAFRRAGRVVDEIARLRAEADGLRAALAEIRDRCGVVCPEFEICHHPSCQSSVTAWMIADEALGPSPAPEADPGF